MQESSGHLGQDGREANERAKELQADALELVWFLVGAKLLEMTLAGVMFEAIMAWASDAAEHKGRLQERNAALGTLINEAPRLSDLARRDADVQASLRSTVQVIATAAQALRGLSPSDPAWSKAVGAFNHAMRQFHDLSGRELRLAAERASLEAVERVAIGDPYLRPASPPRFLVELSRAQQELDDAERATSAPLGPAGIETRRVLGHEQRDEASLVTTPHEPSPSWPESPTHTTRNAKEDWATDFDDRTAF